MERFETIKIDRTTTLSKEGMEVSSYIAGVNSGAYSLPYVISVRVWAKKFFFKRFFYKEMELNIFEVKQFRDECDKVIKWYEESKKIKTT